MMMCEPDVREQGALSWGKAREARRYRYRRRLACGSLDPSLHPATAGRGTGGTGGMKGTEQVAC